MKSQDDLEIVMRRLCVDAPAFYDDIKLAVELIIKRERQDFLSWLKMHDTGIGGLLFTREEYLNVVEKLTGQPASFHGLGKGSDKNSY